MTIAVYPGTFDPMTNGHLDVIARGAALFDRLIVAVGARIDKKTLFSAEERVALIRESCAAHDNVRVESFDGLIVNFAAAQNASVLLRGTRNALDYEYEAQMAVTNRHLAPTLETLFLIADANTAFISSTLVKEILKAGGAVDEFVPPPVVKALKR